MKQNDLKLVVMTQQHVKEIAKLEQLCFSDPWPEESVRSELDNSLSLWFAAVEQDQVIGYVGSQTVMDEADIMNIAVHPDHRKKGVARQLLMKLENTLKEQAVHSLTLEVRPSNLPAVELYQKLGYVQVGCRRGYYHHPKEDAWILRKEWEL